MQKKTIALAALPLSLNSLYKEKSYMSNHKVK